MKSLHPSPTAGDGKIIPQAKYHYPTDKPDHHGRCAMCGFQIDYDVNQSGDTLLTPGITYGAPVAATVKLPASGNAKQVTFVDTTIEPNVIAGCPFCGSFNAPGRFVGDEFGSMTDITNQ